MALRPIRPADKKRYADWSSRLKPLTPTSSDNAAPKYEAKIKMLAAVRQCAASGLATLSATGTKKAIAASTTETVKRLIENLRALMPTMAVLLHAYNHKSL